MSPVYLAGDITLQLTPALHKTAGLVNEYNSYLTIHMQDWSQDKINHISWWPPGFLYFIDVLIRGKSKPFLVNLEHAKKHPSH